MLTAHPGCNHGSQHGCCNLEAAAQETQGCLRDSVQLSCAARLHRTVRCMAGRWAASSSTASNFKRRDHSFLC